jgi:hypothetical protein
LWRFVEKFILQAGAVDLDNKCIDTDPDPSTPPSSADDLRVAEIMANYYKRVGAIVGTLVLASEAVSALANGGLTSNSVQRMGRQAVFLTRFYTGYQRHSKVLSGEWRVTNMPTPERLAELERGKQEAPPQAVADPSPS